MALIASQDLVSIDWTLVAQVIAFLILLYILVRVAYNPLAQAMAARTERIRSELSAAELASKQAQEANERTQALVDQAKQQSQEILRQAAANAETVRSQIIDEARAEAEKVVERGKQEIERERRAAFDDLRRSVSDIAILAASQVVRKSLDSAENRRLVEEAIAATDVLNRTGTA
jgi:F-type H+-transporting ATPase subunit b